MGAHFCLIVARFVYIRTFGKKCQQLAKLAAQLLLAWKPAIWWNSCQLSMWLMYSVILYFRKRFSQHFPHQLSWAQTNKFAINCTALGEKAIFRRVKGNGQHSNNKLLATRNQKLPTGNSNNFNYNHVNIIFNATRYISISRFNVSIINHIL